MKLVIELLLDKYRENERYIRRLEDDKKSLRENIKAVDEDLEKAQKVSELYEEALVLLGYTND